MKRDENYFDAYFLHSSAKNVENRENRNKRRKTTISNSEKLAYQISPIAGKTEMIRGLFQTFGQSSGTDDLIFFSVSSISLYFFYFSFFAQEE